MRRNVVARSMGLGVVTVVALGLAAGCSGSSNPDLVGRWEGVGRLAVDDGSVESDPEVLTIERQDDELLWGTVEYEENGEMVVEDVVGTLYDDGDRIALNESDATWRGDVDGDTLNMVISWTGEQYGVIAISFERVED